MTPERRGWTRDDWADWFLGRGRWRVSPIWNVVILAMFVVLLVSVLVGAPSTFGRWIVIVISVPMIVRSGLQLMGRIRR